MSGHEHHHGMGVMEGWWEARKMSGLPRAFYERIFFGNPLKRVLELLDLTGNETIVDSGCGSGYYTLPLAKQLPDGHVEAVELSDSMIKVLGKRIKRARLTDRIYITKGNCEALPLGDGSAEGGVITAVLHHLDHPDKAVAELYRVLKPGSRVVAVDWNPDAHHHSHSHHHSENHGQSEVSINELLETAGFASVQTEPWKAWMIGSALKP